jgi:hypothetical protein
MSTFDIDVGDTVEIVFGECRTLIGVVRSRPCAEGDSWTIESNTHFVNVQRFESMWKKK